MPRLKYFSLSGKENIEKNYLFFMVIIFLLQLASVDVEGALNMYIEKGEWQKCLDTAEQQVGSWYTLQNPR